MTELLEQAIAKLKTLPASEQDAMAALILEELEDEILWDKAFEQSQHVLASLAAGVSCKLVGREYRKFLC